MSRLIVEEKRGIFPFCNTVAQYNLLSTAGDLMGTSEAPSSSGICGTTSLRESSMN